MPHRPLKPPQPHPSCAPSGPLEPPKPARPGSRSRRDPAQRWGGCSPCNPSERPCPQYPSRVWPRTFGRPIFKAWGTHKQARLIRGRVGELSNDSDNARARARNVREDQGGQGVEVRAHLAPQGRTLPDRLKRPVKTTARPRSNVRPFIWPFGPIARRVS